MGRITMHPLRKLRDSGKPTAAQVSELLAENIVFNSPILVRPIEGREVVAIGRTRIGLLKTMFSASSSLTWAAVGLPESRSLRKGCIVILPITGAFYVQLA